MLFDCLIDVLINVSIRTNDSISSGVVDKGMWTELGGRQLGQVSGVAVDPITNHVLVFHRPGRPWGAGFVFTT
jgi:hypothetical protein